MMSSSFSNKLYRKQSLEAVQVYACDNCQAPGLYKSIDDKNATYFAAGWPGVMVAADDPRVGQPVGDICPNCSKPRLRPNIYLGEIWSKTWNIIEEQTSNAS